MEDVLLSECEYIARVEQAISTFLASSLLLLLSHTVAYLEIKLVSWLPMISLKPKEMVPPGSRFVHGLIRLLTFSRSQELSPALLPMGLSVTLPKCASNSMDFVSSCFQKCEMWLISWALDKWKRCSEFVAVLVFWCRICSVCSLPLAWAWTSMDNAWP